MWANAAGIAGAGLDRQPMLQALRDAVDNAVVFDSVIIGGGVTGAGVALDAASRGLRVLLVDRGDLASGTSSKSSKLVHGGLRYLQQGDVDLVREALRERRILMRNAPHLVSTLPFLIPILTRDGLFPRRIARALGSALWAYDAAGGWRIGRLHRRVRRRRVGELCPGLPAERVAGGYLYFDARADDARLTLDLARTAAANGALVLSHCPVTRIATDGGTVAGVEIVVDGEHITVASRTVVNAAGVWAAAVDALVDGPLTDALPAITVRPARGVHVSIPWELVRNTVAVVLPVPGDRRSVFLIPSGPRSDGTFDVAHIGTTDTDHGGGLDNPECTADDVDYLLRAVNHALGRQIRPDQVLGVWAGLRPLVVPAGDEESSRTADLSRRHQVDASPSGIVRVIGGKLTTYRQMAEDTVDALAPILGTSQRCVTRTLRIIGRDDDTISSIINEDPSRSNELVPGCGVTAADVVYAARHETALTVEDMLTRRSRIHIDHRDLALAVCERVAELMAREHRWTPHQTADEIARYRSLCEAERMAAEVHS